MGFVDGGFYGQNTSYCNLALIEFEEDITNFTLAIEAGDMNNSVYYGAYILRYFNPFAFHCYYAGKETYVTFEEYLLFNSWAQIT